jgi:chemotaxis protein MotB
VARRRRHDEHENHEAWAIPYGDLMTLLLAFFVVMYSISSVNSGKYRVLSDALVAEFRGTPRAPQPIAVGDERALAQQLPAMEVKRLMDSGLPGHAYMPLPDARGSQRVGEARPGSADPRQPLAAQPAENTAAAADSRELKGIQNDVTGALGSLIQNDLVKVLRQGDAVEVQISADILFNSGSAEPAAAAVPVLQRLADALRPWPNAVRVEGHTDDVPIRSGVFRSNWELSGARAGSVVRLFAERGMDPQRLEVAGYGQYRPIRANSDAAGRNANRRVAIIILGRGRNATASTKN